MTSINLPYFLVKSFTISYKDKNNTVYVHVTSDIIEYICNDINFLQDIDSENYNPSSFLNFIQFISNTNKDKLVKVHYKYKFYNHLYLNEYTNVLTVYNGQITDKLLNKGMLQHNNFTYF
jgi:hypothetical protein